MSGLVVAPVLVALATAVLALLARPSDRLRRALSLAGGGAYLVAVAALARAVFGPPGDLAPTTLVYRVGDWPAPFGIVLVADALAAFLLVLAGVVALAGVAYALVDVDADGQRLSFHPLYHLMIAGVSGALLTGDVFNLFVWFEVMLMASYVLVAFGGGPSHTRAALQYVVLNLVGSAVMLVAIGGLYATTGTLNMADMARRLADPGAYGVAVLPTLGLLAVLLAVFALKAGLVPFHFWVPAAYRAAPAPVTAVLAGVVKKVGVYAVVRLTFTVLAAASFPVSLPALGIGGDSPLGFVGPALALAAAASVVLGGVGAVGRDELDELLAYSSISQIGFVVLPLAIAATVPAARTLGIAAALVYAFNHGLAKALLFLASGTIAAAVGSTRFGDLGGLAPRTPVLAGSFLLGALALVGIPPLAGFFGKLLVFDTAARAAAVGATGATAALALVLVGAVLTIAYYTRAWNAAFWGTPSATVEARLPRSRTRPAGPEPDAAAAPDGGYGDRRRVTDRGLVVRVSVVAALAVAVVGFGLGFEVVFAAAEAGAEAAVDTEGYVDAVAPAEVLR